MCTNMHACLCACMHVHACMCGYACLCVHVHMCLHNTENTSMCASLKQIESKDYFHCEI